MAEPFDRKARSAADAMYLATIELISAMSALNMDDEQVSAKELKRAEKRAGGRPVYISEKYYWAKHAMEHLHTVFDYIEAAKRYDWRYKKVLSKFLRQKFNKYHYFK